MVKHNILEDTFLIYLTLKGKTTAELHKASQTKSWRFCPTSPVLNCFNMNRRKTCCDQNLSLYIETCEHCFNISVHIPVQMTTGVSAQMCTVLHQQRVVRDPTSSFKRHSNMLLIKTKQTGNKNIAFMQT